MKGCMHINNKLFVTRFYSAVTTLIQGSIPSNEYPCIAKVNNKYFYVSFSNSLIIHETNKINVYSFPRLHCN